MDNRYFTVQELQSLKFYELPNHIYSQILSDLVHLFGVMTDRMLNAFNNSSIGFRPLSGSYISQYHPRNPMFCLGQIGGLRGKSNFIEMQPFWKVKNSHKSSI